MKKNKRNLTLAIIVTAIIGTVLIKTAEYMFGTVNVFMFFRGGGFYRRNNCSANCTDEKALGEGYFVRCSHTYVRTYKVARIAHGR